jgi:isopenicillin N synthase-like dioxygenase
LFLDFKEVMQSYSAAIQKLGASLMRAIAMSLGIKESYFEEHFGKEPVLFFRLLNYPPTKSPTLGVGEHT